MSPLFICGGGICESSSHFRSKVRCWWGPCTPTILTKRTPRYPAAMAFPKPSFVQSIYLSLWASKAQPLPVIVWAARPLGESSARFSIPTAPQHTNRFSHAIKGCPLACLGMRSPKRCAGRSWSRPSVAGREPLKRRDAFSSLGRSGMAGDNEGERPTALRSPSGDSQTRVCCTAGRRFGGSSFKSGRTWHMAHPA